MLDCIRDSKSPLIYGDGSTSMDFVYVRDIARAMSRHYRRMLQMKRSTSAIAKNKFERIAGCIVESK